MRNSQLLQYIASSVALLATACNAPPPSFTMEAEPISDHEGKVVIEHIPPQNQTYQKLHKVLQQSQEFDAIASDLDAKFSLRQNLTFSFQDCGESQPSDHSSPDKIALCYEFLQQHLKIVRGETPNTESFTAAAIDTALLMFFNELGHAFIQQYQLPTNGSKEDAADAFAAIMLSDLQGKAMVAINTEPFQIEETDQAELQKLPFWQAHAFKAQRYDNIACIIDSKFEELSQPSNPKTPLQARAQRCLKNYQDHRKSWDALLSPLQRQTSKQGLETPKRLTLLHACIVARPQQITPLG